jgi:Cys-tRNA(Pro)/Cys-tRNA(Cys) deacylase
MASAKTNAARLLDKLAIPYEIREYEFDPDDISAQAVAKKVSMPPEQVFKTLVARGDCTGVLFAVVPANTEIDLKALAHLSGDRRVEIVSLKEVQPLTGYLRGGVTALACKKSYPVFADETMTILDRIAVSAGVRGAQLVLAAADYLKATAGTCGPIARG